MLSNRVLEKLDRIQHIVARYILIPKSSVKVARALDVGLMAMKHRVSKLESYVWEIQNKEKDQILKSLFML